MSGTTLFYIVDWLPPDFGAVGQYALQYATQAAKAGRTVHLLGLTSAPPSRQVETFSGGGKLTVTRLTTRVVDKSSYLARLLWAFWVNLRLVFVVFSDPASLGADVVFTGSPPFMLYFSLWLKWLRRAHLTYRITDFYPEVIAAALPRSSRWIGLLTKITWALRRRIDAFEALGEDQKALLMASGVSPSRITVRRDTSPVQIRPDHRPAAKPEVLGGRRALLYSGNMGVAHEVDTVIEGLIAHHRTGADKFALWLNGTGPGADRMVQALTAAGAPFARTQPVSLEALPSLLLAADAHLVTLKPAFAGIVLPSKIYGCLASARPIIFVGPAQSDVHLLAGGRDESASYIRVEPGDGAAMAKALDECAATFTHG